MEYFAFGETFVEEHSNTDKTPYLFNGKELDEETGLYYYGARYYSGRESVWLSADPLAEKYSHLSPYVYVANNPICAKDPDGKRIYFIPGLGYQKGSTDNGPYAENITNALGQYTAKYGTTSLTVDGSHGLMGDMLHVMVNAQKPASSRSIKEGTRIYEVAKGIANDLRERPLQGGEQLNVMGFSQGSVTTAQAVIDMIKNPSKYDLDENFKIDNLILGGSPIAKNSKLFKEIMKLQGEGKIGNVMYDEAQLPGDKVTGLGGKNAFQAFRNGIGFIGRMLTKHGRENDVHFQAASDKNHATTNFVIQTLDDKGIH
jgi:RHS repeat-associated protein